MLRLTKAIVTATAALAMTAAAAVPAVAAPRPAPKPAPEYYLSLGDSLSVGDQPNAKGVTLPTHDGYADQLEAVLTHTDSDIQLIKLGCPGETSHTLNLGGICGYMGAHRFSLTAHTGAQLAAAIAFLHFHRGQVPLITIDIGANDLNQCIALGDPTKIALCLEPVFPKIAANLVFTLSRLRAADPTATIVGMNYYLPELAAWLQGPAGQTFAKDSIGLSMGFNNLLATAYGAAKVPVADVSTAFKTNDITDMVTVPPFGSIPVDVALICKWTWECVPPPVGPNEHANKAGYGVIATAFQAVLKKIKSPF
jgi:lysophospholipase L1-like esterase